MATLAADALLAKARNEIETAIRHGSTSHWLSAAPKAAVQRDAVDAANDAEELSRLLNQWCDALLAYHAAERKGGAK